MFEITVTADIVYKRKKQHSMTVDDEMEVDDNRSVTVVEERSHHGDTVCYPSTSTSQDVNITKGILPLATTYKRLCRPYI